MDHLQDIHESNFTEVIDDRINNLQQPNQGQYSLNVPPYQQYDDFSTMGNQARFMDENPPTSLYTTGNYEQHPSFSFINNEQITSTSLSYEPQYNNNYIPHIQSPPDDVQNPFNFPHFEFEIPGFKIFIVPTVSNLTNLNNVQNQFQNDSFSSHINNNSI
ncbi:hypothetical protein C1645_826935 [Glomus cerebriforme]|uniref:Uncharacterized protein n=1 Tax=Glomus cerebriforme TaxID=658196 RepID=A0A397SQR4_9GLOM|nr:hypothetical protein C1645_826935 [Glomus cerebriforme]